MRGLLAIEPLYHQIVAGKKTQTRRSGGLELINKYPETWFKIGVSNAGGPVFTEGKYKAEIPLSRYKVGEVLYLKEPIATVNLWSGDTTVYKYGFKDDDDNIKWSNKLFMAASCARAFVRITEVKCERLLDISDEDCIAEGIASMGYHGFKNYLSKSDIDYELNAVESFISLYKFANKISAKKEVKNLWVWVYSFQYLPNFKP